MKNLVCRILLLGSVLLVRGVHPLPVRAQQDAPAPRQAATVFQQADEIVIYTHDSLSVARRTIARLLQANGFVLDTALAQGLRIKYKEPSRGCFGGRRLGVWSCSYRSSPRFVDGPADFQAGVSLAARG